MGAVRAVGFDGERWGLATAVVLEAIASPAPAFAIIGFE
jgi:hypothetical protein